MITDAWLRQTGICVPPRTRLFCLEPIGLGSSLVECLPSYLTRLGDAHFLSASKMMHEVCPPLRRSDGISTPSANWMTDDEFLTKELNNLTGRNDLQNLTLLPWKSLVSSISSYRHYRARCLLCIHERQIDYQPLLWCLTAVRTCPVHRVPLNELCPFCAGKVRLRRTEVSQDSCTQCGKDYRCFKDHFPSMPDATEWDVWVAEQVAALLMNPPQAHEQLTNFNAVIKELVLPNFGIPCDAGMRFRLHSNFFYKALHQKTSTLERWCALAWGMGLELRQLMTQLPSTLQIKSRTPLYDNLSQSRDRHTPASLQAKFDALLQADTANLLSHRKAAALLKVSPAILQKYCPETSDALHKRFKDNQSLTRTTRDQEWLRKIERVIRYFQDHQGVTLSEHAIRKNLGTTGMPHNFSELVEQVRYNLSTKS